MHLSPVVVVIIIVVADDDAVRVWVVVVRQLYAHVHEKDGRRKEEKLCVRGRKPSFSF